MVFRTIFYLSFSSGSWKYSFLIFIPIIMVVMIRKNRCVPLTKVEYTAMRKMDAMSSVDLFMRELMFK